ncbi:MAG TPA: histidine phosphatase family protein [Thermoanaerobaculia bacterium]|nr:histidine phosphatase family protein [Thermoanaerobaculia bacterium]
MITRVYLIRHGATQLSAEDRFAGAVDVLLSDEGRDQARRLGERLSTEKLTAFYSSPMKRTVATAELIAAPHGTDITPIDAFREIAHGRWEGRTRAEVEREHAEEYARWEHDPYTFAPVGGESGLEVTARALPALLRLVEQHQGERFVIVSHKATIRLLLSSLLGFDSRNYRDRLDQSPAALNVLDFKDLAHARLTLFNDTSHYAGRDIPELPRNRLSKIWDEDDDSSSVNAT